MYYVIGDIHGMLYSLVNIINKIKSIDNNPYFIFVGDYCDRGLYSKNVVDYLLTLNPLQCTFLLGNHDDVFNYFIGNNFYTIMNEMTNRSIYEWWVQYGFLETLNSYGIKDINLPIPMPSDHKEFYANLKLFWENDKYFVMHGYLNPNQEIGRFGISNILNSRSSIHESLWGRFDSYTTPKKWGKIGIFGHTPGPAIFTNNIVNVDTGCFMGGPLTAFCLETKEFIQCSNLVENHS